MKVFVNEILKYFEETRGIKPGDELEILSKGIATAEHGFDACYLVQGKKGTPIVLYKKEVTLVRGNSEY
jgi:hypothetical protein